jgi:peptidyl-prolyl cis-trans isomerase B (cyclophilin B)
MMRILSLALVGLLACTAAAQTVRFETSAGDFDVVLNPTSNPLLQGHVDNLLQYVTSGRYDNTVINRADENFVLQMGSFKTADTSVPATIDGFLAIDPFAPVDGAPGNSGLSNTRGMIGMALRGNSNCCGIDRNSGTSSFYINLGDNFFLDQDFTIFAQIPNMATVDAIMALPRVDLTQDPSFGAGLGNLAFTDVPLLGNGKLVVITRAFVVPEPTTLTLISISSIVCLAVARRKMERANLSH